MSEEFGQDIHDMGDSPRIPYVYVSCLYVAIKPHPDHWLQEIVSEVRQGNVVR